MDFTNKNCPVCSEKFASGDDIVVCPKCGAPYHRSCYEIKGKCIFPELHKSGESWQEYTDREFQKSLPPEDDGRFVVCRHCGHKNSTDSIVCDRCGDFLPSPAKRSPVYTGHSFDEQKSSEELPEGFPPIFQNGRVNIDEIRQYAIGIKNDDDFDGVTGEELTAFIGSNEMYYGPIFSSIKKRNTSRFNFATFFFFDIWYLYRKQYLKGIFFSLLTLIPIILNYVCITFFTGDLWDQAQKAVGSSGRADNYIAYGKWIMANCDLLHAVLMLLPFAVNIIFLAVKIILSFSANKSYYKFAVKKIKKIKAKETEADHKQLIDIIRQKGGIHTGLAFMVLACEVIIVGTLTFM